MRCYEIQDVLTEFIEGSLPAERTREVVDHIARCKACERDVTRMENLVASLRSLPPIPPPERLRPAIADAVRAVSQQHTAQVQPLRRRYMWLGAGVGAAAAAAVFLGIVFALRPALLKGPALDQVASTRMFEEEAQQQVGAGGRVTRNAPIVELAPDEELLTEEQEEELEEGEAATAEAGEAVQEPHEPGELDEFAQKPPGPDSIQARADALAEELWERRGRMLLGDAAATPAETPALAETPPAPQPSESESLRGAEMPAARSVAPYDVAVPTPKPPPPSTAPPPPSARARGLWTRERPGRSITPAPAAKMAERAEDEEEEGRPSIAAEAETSLSSRALMGRRAPVAEASPRLPFGKTPEVQIELRRGEPLRAHRAGELLVTVHANADVEDARIMLDVPAGVQLGAAYRNGEVFRGRLGKDMTRTFRVPIIPQEPGTKTFSAQARRADRDALLAVAQVGVPVEAAAAPTAMTTAAPAGSGRPAGPGPAGKALYTFTFNRVGLRVALLQAAEEAGVKVQIDPRVQNTKVTYSAVARPIDEIMRALAAKGACQAAFKGDVWHISPRSGGQ